MEAAVETQSIPQPKTLNPKNYIKKSKSQEIRKMIKSGCRSVKVLSDVTGTHPALASRILKQYKIETNQLDDYKLKRADIYAGLQHRLLSSISIGDIKKTPLGSRVLAAVQLYDKERLERGQSTENIAQLTAAVASIKSAEMSHDVTDNGTIVCQNEDDKSTGHD